MTDGDSSYFVHSHDEFDSLLQKKSDSAIGHATTDPSTSSEDNSPLQRIGKVEVEDEEEEEVDGGRINGDNSMEPIAVCRSSEDSSSADFLLDSILLGSVDSQDEPVLLDKAEVRKSILKGKSELSKSRQKNHALKAVDHGIVSSAHSSFILHANTKAHPATRKLSSSAHDPSYRRSLSNDDIQFVGDEGTSSRLASSRKLVEGNQEQPLSLDDLRGALKDGNQSTLPAFCTPRRDPNTKTGRTLNVDAKAMMFGVGDLSIGPTRSVPKRSYSAQTRRHSSVSPLSHGAQPRVNLVGGSRLKRDEVFESIPGPPRPVSRCKSMEEVPRNNSFGVSRLYGNSGSDASLGEATKLWDNPSPGNLQKDSFPDGIAKSSNAEDNVSKSSTSSRHSNSRSSSFDPFEIAPVQSGSKQSTSDPSTSSRNGSHRSAEPASDGKFTAAASKIVSSSSLPIDQRNELLHSHPVEENQAYVQQQEEEEVELWTCWGCEYSSNFGEHLFCGMCGTGRDWLCPTCQHENKSSFNFCGMCGSRKGRVVIHKQQPEGFDMRIRRAKRPNHGAIQKSSPNSKSSIAAPPTSSNSVASGKSSSRRTSVASKTAGTKPRTGDNSDESKEKRPSRGRARESISKKSREERTRSSSRIGRDGKEVKEVKERKERKSRTSVASADGKKERKSEKKEADKGERKSRRPPRKATSVPPAERKDIVKDGTLTKMSSTRPGIKKSNSLTKLEANEIERIPTSPLVVDSGDDAERRSSKLWILKKVINPLSAEENDKILGGDLGATDHSLWRPIDRDGSYGDVIDDNQQQQTNRAGDPLVTPSIKKRLLKMRGNLGGKLFKSTELPMGDDAANEPARFAEISIKKNPSNENCALTTGKPQNGVEPPTPSLKKRLLGNIGWGSKSGHGKGLQDLPMMPDASMVGNNPLDETEDIYYGNEQTCDEGDHPLVGLSTGLVVTAKDMRPNRPNNNQRRKPPSEVRARRKSHEGGLDARLERPVSNKRRPPPRRTKSTDSASMPRRRHQGEIDSGGDRKRESSNQDVLGDRLSEAESIHSMED